MKLLLAVLVGGITACDYAKPTDVEKVDDRVTALEQQLNSESKNRDEEIRSIKSSMATLAMQVDSNVIKIDSLMTVGEKEDEVNNAIQFIEIMLDKRAYFAGDLTVGGDALQGFMRGEAYILSRLEISEESNISILGDGDTDIVLEVFQLFPFAFLGTRDDDDSSPYGEDWDRSVYSETLEPGTYWIGMSSYYADDQFEYAIEVE